MGAASTRVSVERTRRARIGDASRVPWRAIMLPQGGSTSSAATSLSSGETWSGVQNDVAGRPNFLFGESDRRPRETAEVHTAACRSTRRRCVGQGSRVFVRSDGTLSLERRRQEREEAKLLVQTVTSEVSSCSGSPCVAGRLSPE
ncbi:hypothetical protein NDU88_004164 [Pleurodeles waltl]|uniref:Uncharacterized protein n=1 Tax=Pleurodeles waltl TaxID=8319 RepID=A0AAV7M5J7_PLEWA|nr:hypothetical protein NDU88_004164 [Pleurodeles waltl]